MSDHADVLLSLYLDDIAFARHHESLRSTITNLILAVGAALGALVGYDNKITCADVPAAVFLILVGLGGAAFSYKHYERFHSHYGRAREIRSKLDEISGLELKEMRNRADEKHRESFPRSYKWSAGRLWAAIPLCVSILGLLILIAAL